MKNLNFSNNHNILADIVYKKFSNEFSRFKFKKMKDAKM